MKRETRHRLWIVDDVPLELEASSRALGPFYDVDLFGDGSTVLERFGEAEHPPDVLVLDWHMDGVNGIDVLKFLRANPPTVGLPILVFTATGDQRDLLEALDAGADDFVGKGASTAELHARVATLIRSKSLRERAERAERELVALLEREQGARAEAEAANQAKDQFLATVSHELRTPLTAILGWARLLKTGAIDAAKRERAIDTIERNATAQAKIIDDLLDVSRIVSGKLRLDLAPVELTDVIEQAVESLRPTAAAKGIRIEADIDDQCVVAGDSARIQQVAWNLLSNSVKFTSSEGRIGVRLARDRNDAVLSVEDTGAGIAPELLPHVFDRFRQGDSTTTRTQGGMGLGLAIVRQLVQLHGGRVSASSGGVGRGASFEVRLPLLPAIGTPRPGKPELELPLEDLTGILVLVVEDDHDTRELVRDLLAERGATVIDVGSAREALAILEQRTPDLILSDVAMPEQDGHAMMRQIRSRPLESGGWIPAVAVTALARDEDQWEALAAGFQAHVSKPIDPPTLVRVVARLCTRERSAR